MIDIGISFYFLVLVCGDDEVMIPPSDPGAGEEGRGRRVDLYH